jgi:type IX secretion system PorP/SprF family membrane protein
MKKFYCSALLLCLLAGVKAQDIHFSQFFEAPLLRNPSLAGIFTGDIRVQAVYRDQWNSFTNAYRTGSLNAEYKMPVGRGDDFLTTGMQVLFDKAGSAGLTSTHVMPALNYHKSLSGDKVSYLSLGFMGGMIRKSIDLSKISTNSQYGGGGYDPTAPTGEQLTVPSFTSWDASVGMSFNTSFGVDQLNSMFLGAAYHHLNRPKNSFYRNPEIELSPKFVFSSGVKLIVDDYTYVTLHADHSTQGTFKETIGGAMYSYKIGGLVDEPLYTVHAGAFLRWKDAFVPVVKMDMQSLSVAVSYDVNMSPLKTASMGRGGFELSLTWTGFVKRDNDNSYGTLCPRF